MEGDKLVAPTPIEVQQYKLLAKVAASANGGGSATAIQEAVFSSAAMAEMGKRSSRTLPQNLSTRVFNVVNKHWRAPIKGTKVPVYSLRRKANFAESSLPAKRLRRVEDVKKQSKLMSTFLKIEKH